MNNKSYLIFWFSQMVSQLGSAMTTYALTLWSFGMTGHAMTVSSLMLCSWRPFVRLSPFAGVLVDRLPKKRLLLLSDTVTACGTLCALLLVRAGVLRLWHISLLNALAGAMSAIQCSASAVAVGLLVPKEHLPRVAGLRGFSNSAVGLFAPMLAAGVFGFWGLDAVILCDLLSFCFALCCLLFLVHIPETPSPGVMQIKESMHEGFRFLRSIPGLRVLIGYMALVNLLAQVTYENILSPMLLARSGSVRTAGTVSSMIGFAGIIGGMFVAGSRRRKDPVLLVFGAAAVSFLLGDLLLGAGRSLSCWLVAGFTASFPVPFIQAGQHVLYYGIIPRELQGRVFAAVNSLQTSTVPIGLLLGGFLADRVFEPLMASGIPLAQILARIVGTGRGSGMAVMFLCTGTLGFLLSILCGCSRAVRTLAQQVQELE